MQVSEVYQGLQCTGEVILFIVRISDISVWCYLDMTYRQLLDVNIVIGYG